MFEQIFNKGILFYVIAGVCAGGVLSNMILSFLYRRMLKDSKNMASPKTHLMKQMKNRFENSFRLKESVNNVGVFVDKWMYQYRFCGLTLQRIKKLNIYAMAVNILASGAGTYLAYYYNHPNEVLLNYIGAGAAALVIQAAVRGLLEESYKQQVIKTNVRDYLENSLSNRLQTDNTNTVPVKERKPAVQAAATEETVQASQKRLSIDKKPEKEVRQEKARRDKQSNPYMPEEAAVTQSQAEKPAPSEKILSRDRLSKKEVKENVDKMKESMNQIAAGNARQRQKNREILKSMDQKQQEEVIREILKEFLS